MTQTFTDAPRPMAGLHAAGAQAAAPEHRLPGLCLAALAAATKVYMRLVSLVRPDADCATTFGARVHCHSRDFIQRRIRHFGIFEHNLTHFTLGCLRRGDVYLDIGANIGYFTLLRGDPRRRRRAGDLRRGGIRNLAALEGNVALNGLANVTALNVAATAARCRVAVHRTEAHNCGANEIAVRRDGAVEGLPFRDIAGSDLGLIRFIKIDVEGSEAPILGAILEARAEMRPDLVIASEMSPASAGLVPQFVAAGFRVYALQNVYTIDYYLLRAWLGRFGEDRSIHLRRVEAFEPGCRDYILERGPEAAPTGLA